jgi:DNA-binding protein HU-beta
MNKSELVKEAAEDAELTQVVLRKALDSIEKIVKKTVKKGEKVALTRFYSWDAVKTKAGIRRNPKTGAQVKVESKIKVKGKAGSEFLTEVNSK